MDGPGVFGVFTTGSFGDSTVIFDSTDGLPDGLGVPLGTHAHANWGFARQGVYRLTFDVTAKLAGGKTVSDKEIYTFAVGDARPERARSGTSGDAAGESRDRGLANTGLSGVLPLTAGGLVLLGIGGVALLAGRRRRRTER